MMMDESASARAPTHLPYATSTPVPGGKSASTRSQLSSSQQQQQQHQQLNDISDRGRWSVSSFKFGFGTECLRDNDPETFWHSDGPQPHSITVEFPRKVAIQKLSVLLNFSKDDSYTPSALAIRAGTGRSDLQDVRMFQLDKPDGWVTFDVSTELNEDGDGFKPVYAYVLQIIIAANHLSGKDTHVRGLMVLGPEDERLSDGDPFPWHNAKFRQFEAIR